MQSKRLAQERVAFDMPYVSVEEAQIYQYHEQSGRWYIEVDVMHREEGQGKATILCRVIKDESGQLSARRIDIAERE